MEQLLDAKGEKIGRNNPLVVGTRFFVSPESTILRPANTTAYSANDAVSNSATAGLVTPLLIAAPPDMKDSVLSLERIRLITTDTGFGAVTIRAFIFTKDAQADGGVAGGDNAAFSMKRGNFIGSMSGTLRAFSDGAAGLLVSDEGNRIICRPAQPRLFVFLQTLGAVTPSANSTAITIQAEGFQGLQ